MKNTHFVLVCFLIGTQFCSIGMSQQDEIEFRYGKIQITNNDNSHIYKNVIGAYKQKKRIGWINYSYIRKEIFPFDQRRKKSPFYYKRIINKFASIDKMSGMVFGCFLSEKYCHSPENVGESLARLALRRLQKKGVTLALVESLDEVIFGQGTDVPEYSAVFLKNKQY